MKKRYFWSILAIMMVSMLSVGLVSCGGDDDGSSSGGGDASTNVGKLDKDFNKRIKSVGNIYYYYKDNGLLDYIVNGNHRYDFTYNPNTIVETRNGKDKITYNVSYDGLGHITKFEFTKVYEEGKNTEKFTCSTTLTYNSEHLTNISSYSNSEVNGVKGYETISTALNWKNNLLMSVVCDETEQEEGDEKASYRETYTYSYDNANINDYHNKHHQYTPSIVKFLGDELGDDDLARPLAYVGLLGSGPLYLPVSSEDTDEDINTNDSNPYYRKYTRNFKYGFNSDGSVNYTNVDGSRTNFTYEDIKN